MAATRSGKALAGLTHLFLFDNRVGDGGMGALTAALADGALRECRHISLARQVHYSDGAAKAKAALRAAAADRSIKVEL